MAAEIVDLDDYRVAKAVARGRATVKGRLKIELTAELTAADLPDRALAFLIRPDPLVASYLQELVTKIMGLGPGFDSLGQNDRVKVIDSHLLLADQFRFEALRRLGWVLSYPGQEIPLVRLALDPLSILPAGKSLELSPRPPGLPRVQAPPGHRRPGGHPAAHPRGDQDIHRPPRGRRTRKPLTSLTSSASKPPKKWSRPSSRTSSESGAILFSREIIPAAGQKESRPP